MASNPEANDTYGNVAQLVERKVEALGVVGSIPTVPTIYLFSSVELEQRVSTPRVGSSSLSRGTRRVPVYGKGLTKRRC